MSVSTFKSLTEEQKISICLEYKQGALMSDLKDKYDLFYIEVRDVLRDCGAEWRETGEARRLLKDKESEIVARYVGGESLRSLAPAYGVDRSVIKRIIRQSGHIPHASKQFNVKKDFDRQAVVDMYLAGNSMSAVAKKMGLSVSGVSYVVKQAGHKGRHHKVKPTGRPSNLSKDQLTEMARLYTEEGVSVSELLRRFGSRTSTKSLVGFLKRRGVEIRSRSDNNKTYSCDSGFFSNPNQPDQAYILGWLYTDGTIQEYPKQHTSMELKSSDESILEYIKTKIGSDRPICHTAKQTSIWAEHDKTIFADLMRLGLHQNKSKTVEYPTWLSEEVFSHFLRGAIEGDGSVLYYPKRHHLTVAFCGASPFARKMVEKIKSLGIKLHVRVNEDGFTYCVATSNDDALRLATIIYSGATHVLPRKFEAFKKAVQDFTTRKHSRIQEKTLTAASSVVNSISS